MSAWEELEGNPKYQVRRFHPIAPTSPVNTTDRVIWAVFTMSSAMVVTTCREIKAPTKFNDTARRISALPPIPFPDKAPQFLGRIGAESMYLGIRIELHPRDKKEIQPEAVFIPLLRLGPVNEQVP
jgi:hypothetical protein